MSSAGMFPYAMICCHFVFSAKDLPKKAIRKLPSILQRVLPTTDEPGCSSQCIYEGGETIKKEKKEEKEDKVCWSRWTVIQAVSIELI